MEKRDKSIISHFIKYQAMYAFISWGIVSWTLFGAKIEQMQIDMVKQETRIEANSLNGQEINTRLASIETSLEFIKQQLR